MIARLLHGRKTFFFLFLAAAIVGTEYAVDVLIGDGDGRLTQPLLKFFIACVFYLSLACAFFSWISEYEKAGDRLAARLGNFFTQTINPQFLGLFRIAFALLALTLLFSSYELMGLINYQSTAEELAQLRQLFWVEIASLTLILFGVGGRIPYIVNFWLGSQYLHGDVGTHLFNMISFWGIFMGLDQALALRFHLRPALLNFLFNWRLPPLKWPVLLMGITLAYTVSTAGVSKLFDPLWRNHMGFYYTFLQPWLRSDALDVLLDQKWLIVAMNWLTVFSEALALPLFMFRRTRFWGALLMVLMFVLLTYPFRIDAIGPFGLIMALLVFLAAPRFDRFRFRFLPYRDPAAGIPVSKQAVFIPLSIIGALLAIWVWLAIYYDLSREAAKGAFRYPRVEAPFVLDGKEAKGPAKTPDLFQLPFFDRLSPAWIFRLGHAASLYKTGPMWYAPFNFQHVLGRSYFRVMAVKDGKETEPFPVFRHDGYMLRTPFSGRIMQERAVSNRLWLFGLIGHKLAVRFDRSVISKAEEESALAFLRFFHEQFEAAGYGDHDIRIDVRYFDLPHRYEGAAKPWLQSPWTKLLLYSPRADTLQTLEQPPLFRPQEYDYPYFRDGRITLQPLDPVPPTKK